jgi:NitT/TauT family transport system ATP-binding protein
MNAQPIVSLRRIGKTFANGVVALDGLSLDVRPGEFLSLLGPSGCGKSTALRLIAGLSAPSTGTIEWPDGGAIRARGDIGFVFQEPTLMPWATAHANVALPLQLTGIPDEAAGPRVRDALARVGLADFADVYPRELSGGMRMRVSLARALVTQPKLLLMDEPFAALDAMTRETIGLELMRIWEERRKTVLFVTHSIPEAVLLADRVVVMTPRPGRIASVIPIDLPRPRTVEMEYDERFKEAALEIRALIDRAGPGRQPTTAGAGAR